MSLCSIESAYEKVKQNPALALGVVETPLGALGLFFLVWTSVYGVQSLTFSDSIIDLMEKSTLQLLAFVSPFLTRAKKAGDSAVRKDWKWFLLYAFAIALTSGLLLGLSTDSITWLTTAMAILFGLGAISLIGRYYSSSIANALVGGAVLGVSVFVIYFLISRYSAYTTGAMLPDTLFVCLLVYMLLCSIAISSTAFIRKFNEEIQKRLESLQKEKKTDNQG